MAYQDLKIPVNHFENYMNEMSDFTANKYEITDETIRCVNEYAGDIVDMLDYPRRG